VRVHGSKNRAAEAALSNAKEKGESIAIDRIGSSSSSTFDLDSLSLPSPPLSLKKMFNGGAPGLGGAPVTKALLLAVGGASLVLRIRGGSSDSAAGPSLSLSRSLGFATAGELIFAAALIYQSRAAERAVGPAAAASGAALGGIGGATLASLARTLLSALLFGRRGGSGSGSGSGTTKTKTTPTLAGGPYALVFALLVPLVLDVPATTSIVLAGPGPSSAPGSPRPGNNENSNNASTSTPSTSTSTSTPSSRGIKITDKHFLYFEALQLLLIGGRRAWLPALAGVAAGAAVRFDVAGLGSLRFPPAVSAAAARVLGPLLGWAPIKECVVLPSAANAAARARFISGAGGTGGGGYGLGVAGRAPPPPPPGAAGAGAGGASWAAAAAEPSAASVAQLVAMGFSEPDARAALRRRGGDVSAALSDLLG